MKIAEVEMDVLNAPQGYYLVNAISKDLCFKIGLPAAFDRAFDLKNKFDMKGISDCVETGKSYVVDNVFSLVVKDSTYQKADEDELTSALIEMREQMDDLLVRKIAMPRLCCGKNGIDWDEVKDMLEFVFDDSDVMILVCDK